jgi:hypothetical protein
MAQDPLSVLLSERSACDHVFIDKASVLGSRQKGPSMWVKYDTSQAGCFKKTTLVTPQR